MNQNTHLHLYKGLFFLMALWIFAACQPAADQNKGHEHGAANHHMNQRSFEELVASFEDSSRIEWQKPDAVISMLGDIHGLTVMDIGCGTGYFAFRMVDAGATVICADVDERFQEYVREKRKKEGVETEDLRLKKIPYDSPELESSSVDIATIVNTYHHIEDRPAYLLKLKEGLKEGGRLMVVDYLKTELSQGPPMEMKLAAEEVLEELLAAGYSNFLVDEKLLPYQYIIIAQK